MLGFNIFTGIDMVDLYNRTSIKQHDFTINVSSTIGIFRNESIIDIICWKNKIFDYLYNNMEPEVVHTDFSINCNRRLKSSVIKSFSIELSFVR